MLGESEPALKTFLLSDRDRSLLSSMLISYRLRQQLGQNINLDENCTLSVADERGAIDL